MDKYLNKFKCSQRVFTNNININTSNKINNKILILKLKYLTNLLESDLLNEESLTYLSSKINPAFKRMNREVTLLNESSIKNSQSSEQNVFKK